ncbi:MAG: C1 family peptidase [Bacteroidetes bacterium]|nr:C1 family peptidase [Bacteroidota bacterium]MBS1684890.1 C1 family peptidase [Bacteroidota bacterium]
MNKIYCAAFLCLSILTIAGCKKDNNNNNNNNNGAHATGYNAANDNVNQTPKAINTRNFAGSNASSLPSSYFLYNYLPPVGDQGQYGTCIGWSTAYYTKTALEAAARNLTSAQLSQTAYQMSAKDLFTAIADNQKGANCDGTNYDAALTLIQTRGVATLGSVPYSSLGNCSQSSSSNNTDASFHKISTYRAIQHNNVSDYIADIKQSLVSNTPVMVGCGVGTGFQSWSGSGVMSAGFDPCGGGQPCGGHAQTIVGYDDSKGAGGAFRLINSWNTTWGDNGYYWVDYNFLFNTLAMKDGSNNYPIYVASNSTDTTTPPSPSPNQSSGVDLATWVEDDYATGSSTPTRQAIYNIYNIGTGTAPAAADWGLYYVYYNAYNANDYGVIFYDEFNTSIQQNTYQCNTSGNQCVVNVDLPANTDFATLGFGTSTLYQNYTMPSITGYYYLILVADAGQKLGDVDYSNNLFYVQDYPVYFTAGFGKNGTGATAQLPAFKNTLHRDYNTLKKNRYNSAVNAEHRNAYTPREILTFIKAKKASGELDAKARTANPQYNGGMGAHQ